MQISNYTDLYKTISDVLLLSFQHAAIHHIAHPYHLCICFLSFALFVASLLLQDRISVAFSAACAFALHVYLCSYCSLFMSSLSSIVHCSQVFLSVFIFWPLHILFFVVGFVVPSWPCRRSLLFLPSITLFQLSSERSFALGCRNNDKIKIKYHTE